MNTTGPLLILIHSLDALGAFALVALCTAVGLAGFRWFEFPSPTAVDALVFGAGLGAVLVSTSLLATCTAFGVHPSSISLALLGSSVVAWREVPTLPALIGRVWLCLVGKERQNGAVVAMLPFCIVVLFLLGLALMPPSDADSLMYHLQVPAEWLRHERIVVSGGNAHTALVGLAHMLYLPLLASESWSGPAVLSAAFALFLGLAVFTLCRRFFEPPANRYALILLWGSPVILLVGITPRIDVTAALFVLLAQYALMVGLFEARAGQSLTLAAVLLGAAVGVKYHGALYGFGLSPLIVVAARRQAGSWAKALSSIAGFTLVVLAVALPWLLKNWFLFHAPLYPFLAKPAPDSWLQPLLTTSAPPTGIPLETFSMQETARSAFNLSDAFLSPGNLAIGLEAQFFTLSPILLLLPLLVFHARDLRLWALGIPAAFYLLLLLIPFPETSIRYLIPALVPLTTVSAVLAVRASARLSPPVRTIVRAILALVAVAPALGTMFVWSTRNAVAAHLAGRLSAAEYLRTNFVPNVRSNARVMEAVNREIAPKSLVLMIFENRGYYLKANVIEDTRLTNWPILAAALTPGQCLERTGITHVLARSGAAVYYEQRGVSPKIIRWGDFDRFAGACLSVLYSEPGVTLYRVKHNESQ